MSNFPQNFDDDTTLPVVNDNLTEIGGDAINALRDAVFNIEMNIGLGAAGTTPSIAARIGLLINPDGTPNSSTITSLGLVTLPITQDQIIDNAQIPESKLRLDYRTLDLFNYIRDLSRDVNLALGWVSVSGTKLEPHLIGAIYRHDLAQIDVAEDPTQYLNNVFRVARDNTDAYSLINDMNNELLAHQWADGSPFGNPQPITTNNGSIYLSNFAHVASGIFLDTTRFAVIPQTNDNVQLFADYIDQNSIYLLGTRIQNLYANGVSVNSRSSSLVTDGYGQPLVPVTPAIAYLRGGNSQNTPVDNINNGDDMIQFMPPASNNTTNSFDEQFALVRVGDIVRVNYGGDGYAIEVAFVISEKKYNPFGSNKTYYVRIAGKNLVYSPNATARIDRNLFNDNKYGVLSTASGVSVDASGSSLIGPVSSVTTPSIILGHPRGAQVLGVGFTPDEFNETHYLLYLALYPDGNPLDGYTVLPAIDVTGNRGTTPGLYTLDSIVQATNQAFRAPGFNYRFTAFAFEGQFGVMLADSYNNSSFSIVSAVVDGAGAYNQTATELSFPNNVIDLFPTTGNVGPDPLGLGPFGANVASPLFQTSYPTFMAAQNATKIFVPLRRNNYYVNGTEQEQLNVEVGQALDQYGDGYWLATIESVNIVPGPPGHVNVTYGIPLDLSSSDLKPGKTLVIQPVDGYSAGVDFGRFVITNVSYSCCPPVTTSITVYDAVHGYGGSPTGTAPVGTEVALYFNSDSVAFNYETSTDFSPVSTQFKHLFEIYIDQNANTYSHERGRVSTVGAPYTVNGVNMQASSVIGSNIDLVAISPKLRGYLFGSVNKITLVFSSYVPATGEFVAYLASYDGITLANQGPSTLGKIGQVTRFYDITNIDYIDISIPVSAIIAAFSTNQYMDIQLFPTLALDEEIMLLSTCQMVDATGGINKITDSRQFGNVSEEQLTTSALDYIAAPDRVLHFNGVIRGFDITDITNEFITINGGLAVVDGQLTNINNQIITIPKIVETYLSVNYPINFALCINSDGEMVTQPLTDYDGYLGTPNVGDRVMTVTNVVTANSYQVDSNLFSSILNRRKDLAMLYIISSTVTGGGSGATVSLSSRDVRRHSNDSDANAPAILTSSVSQGNFQSLSAALNWLKFNALYQNTLQVKGIFTEAIDPGLNFPLDIEGAGALAGITFSAAMVMSEVNFIGVGILFNSTLSTTGVSFSGCIVTLNANTTLTDTAFTDCTVNLTTSMTAPITTTGVVTFTNCIINVPIGQAFVINSGLAFVNCVWNYTFNPNPGGVPVPGYSTTNLVNDGYGLLYTNLTGELVDFTVTDCTFNYYYADHYPMVSMQFSAYGAIAHYVNITNNKFICVPIVDDLRAVISLTSTLTSPASDPTYPPFPKLVGLDISNNACSHDQMILVSTARTPGQPITGAMLACTDCKIADNLCGVIAYITASDFTSNDFNSVPGNIGAIRDKSDQLVIVRNTCKMITNLDNTGQYITFRATDASSPADWVQVGTGDVLIANNSANWILVGNAVWSAGSSYTSANAGTTLIHANRITPGNIAILSVYKDTQYSNIAPPAMGILLRGAASAQVDYMSRVNIISDNIISPKTLLQPNGVYDAYGYAVGIKCEASANIFGNTVSSVVAGGLYPIVYLGGTSSGGPVINLTDNVLNRNGLLVAAYVQAANSNAINQVKITDNSFDSTTVDGISNTNVGLNIPAAWTFHSNKNQTFYVSVPLLDYNLAASTTGASGAVNTSGEPINPVYGNFLGDSNNFFIGKGFGGTPATLVTGLQFANAQYTIVEDLVGSTTGQTRGFSLDLPIDRLLPPNTRIINAKMGFIMYGTGTAQLDQTATAPATYNGLTLGILTYNNTHTSNDAVNGVLDVQSNYQLVPLFVFIIGADVSANNYFTNTYYINTATQENNLKTTTQYLTVDLSGANITTGQNYRIAAEVNFSFRRLAPSPSTTACEFVFSPVVLQCVYG